MLVVLVVRDAAAWLRETVAALAAQTYPRMAVLGVDDASTDDSRPILEQALGERRVIALPRSRGLARARSASRWSSRPRRRPTSCCCCTTMPPSTPTPCSAWSTPRSASRGSTAWASSGCKVVDWHEPRRLLDVGRSADIFGHAYTPLQADEIDQGQFDRVLEVLCVSSSAMLVSREAWKRAGLLDERLAADHQGLDLCWRVRIAGLPGRDDAARPGAPPAAHRRRSR